MKKTLTTFLIGTSLAFAGSVFASQVTVPSATSYGQIPVGLSTGNYTPLATSTLKINTSDTVEGSNLYFTNPRVQTFLDTLAKGYFWSTTSANYWETLQDRWSTTSSDYWKTQNNFFSTTSADAWDLTKARWATTSNTYWFTQQTTDGLAQGSTNKYFANSLVDTWLGTKNLGVFFSSTSADYWGSTKGYESVLTFTVPLFRSGNTITWFGLATTSQPASSNILVSNGSNGVYGVATSTLSATSPLTGSFTQIGSGGSLGIQVANGSQNGYLSSGDWTTFNNKQNALGFTAVPNTRNINTTYPLQGGGALSADLTLTTALSTTTSQTWSGANIFNNITRSTTTDATTTSFAILGITGTQCLHVVNGSVLGTGADCGSGTGGGPSTDKFATSTDGVSIYANAAYRIGIGTTTPQGSLTLASSTPWLYWYNSSASANKKIAYERWTGDALVFGTSTDAGATTDLLTLTNGTTTLNGLAFTVGSGATASSLMTGTGTSTFSGGVNLTNGCYGVLGTCIGSGGSLTGTGVNTYIPFWTSANNLSNDSNFVWNNTNKRLGIGSSSPWGVVSIIDPIGGVFQPGVVTATSSFDLPFFGWTASTSGAAGSEVRIMAGNPTKYMSHGDTFDQMVIDGRINTMDWKQMECANAHNSKTAQITSDITGSVLSTTLGYPCGNFSFIEDANGVADFVVTQGSGYVRLRPGATGATVVAGDGMALAGTTAWLRHATNTPVMEAQARIGAVQNATSGPIMIGFSAATGVSADWASDAQNGCFFVASSTKANWQAVCRNTTATIVDTGIASSTVLTGDGSFYSFRVEMHNNNGTLYAVFRMRSMSNQNWQTVATISTNMPSAISLNPIASVGKSVAGLADELHVNRLRVWYKEELW